jgi:hypothetical protein
LWLGNAADEGAVERICGAGIAERGRDSALAQAAGHRGERREILGVAAGGVSRRNTRSTGRSSTEAKSIGRSRRAKRP